MFRPPTSIDLRCIDFKEPRRFELAVNRPESQDRSKVLPPLYEQAVVPANRCLIRSVVEFASCMGSFRRNEISHFDASCVGGPQDLALRPLLNAGTFVPEDQLQKRM
jgi:hypothetical protein